MGEKKTRGEKLITITSKEIYMENQFAVFPREVKEHKTPINLINYIFSEAGTGITFFLSTWVDS